MFIVLSLLLISILSGTSIKGRLGSIDRHLSQLSKCCKLWEIMIMRDLLITSLKLKLKPVLYKKRCACLGLQKSIKDLESVTNIQWIFMHNAVNIDKSSSSILYESGARGKSLWW